MTSTSNITIEELPSIDLVGEQEASEDGSRLPYTSDILSPLSQSDSPVAHYADGGSPITPSSNHPTFPIRIAGDDSSQTTSFRGTTTPFEQSNGEASNPSGTLLPKKIFQLRYTAISCVASIPLSIILFIYFYEALVSKKPTLGPLLFSPSRTLLVITILSQGLGLLISLLFNLVFDTLRWQLISRTKGIRSTTFLGLSSATPTLGIIRLLFGGGWSTHILWCAQRLLIPVLCIFIAVVLKGDLTFKNVYTPIRTVPVLGGLAPLDVSLLAGRLPVGVICILFSTYGNAILGSSNFVTGIDPVACNGKNCTSIFLPGGVFNSRLLEPPTRPNLNLTLLNGDFLTNAPVVLINNAPGYQVEFTLLDENFSFLRNNCTMYGQTQGEGLYICVTSINSTIVAGWSACPTDIVGSCFKNTSWANPLQQTTAMTVYKRYATVAYDTRNFSILSVESISPPELTKIDPFQLSEIYSAAFTPFPNGSTEETDLVNSLLVETGWALRLYHDDFPDSQNLPQDLLRGLLLVPIQFATTAWYWVNSTEYYTNSTEFALPSDLVTTASTAQLTYRAIAKRWTVGAFIAVVSILLIWCNLLLLYLLVSGTVAPNTSAFVEVDVTSKSTYSFKHSRLPEAETQDKMYDFSTILRDAALGNSETTAVINGIRDKRLRLVAADGPRGEKFLVIVEAPKETQSWQNAQGPDILRQGTTYL